MPETTVYLAAEQRFHDDPVSLGRRVVPFCTLQQYDVAKRPVIPAPECVVQATATRGVGPARDQDVWEITADGRTCVVPMVGYPGQPMRYQDLARKVDGWLGKPGSVIAVN